MNLEKSFELDKLSKKSPNIYIYIKFHVEKVIGNNEYVIKHMEEDSDYYKWSVIINDKIIFYFA